MKKLWHKLLMFLFLSAAGGCLEPYEPTIFTQNPGILVVEGYISSDWPMLFHLSRTNSLSEAGVLLPERGAQVHVEGRHGFRLSLEEQEEGIYAAEAIALNPEEQYRLHILTADNREYVSEYMPLKQTPAIDSISWEKKEEGVYVYANTHDTHNNTWYYQWDFEETWEHRTEITTFVDYRNGLIVYKSHAALAPTECWMQASSTSILVATSAMLNQDIMSKAKLVFIPSTSIKITYKYSILVRQRAITDKAFGYFEQMRKNTEQTGSFFDPQPAELPGNIHNVNNPAEPVIGYINAGTVQEKRIYISNREVLPWAYESGCSPFIVNQSEYETYFADNVYEPIEDGDFIYAVVAKCTDCSILGSPVMPDFWE